MCGLLDVYVASCAAHVCNDGDGLQAGHWRHENGHASGTATVLSARVKDSKLRCVPRSCSLPIHREARDASLFRVWLSTLNNLQVSDACINPSNHVQAELIVGCIIGCRNVQSGNPLR